MSTQESIIGLLLEHGIRKLADEEFERDIVDKHISLLLDPNGAERIGTAKRADSGKTQYDLIPPDPLQQIADVFTNGAVKYGERNWEGGMAYSRVLNSMLRHVQAFRKGEDVDQESGLPHMAHVAANAIFLLEYANTHTECDDRRHVPPAQ